MKILDQSKVKSFTRRLPYHTEIAEMPFASYWQ